MAFIAVDLAVAFGFLFFRPRAVGQLWARWLPGVDETGAVLAARALLPRALVLSVALTVGVPLALTILFTLQGVAGLSGGTVALLAPVALLVTDVVDEWRARRRLGLLVSIRPVQRTAEVEPILRALKAAGIEAHARTFCYRVTQQFFAPYAPVGDPGPCVAGGRGPSGARCR